jgi:hypothetical protein
MSHKIPNDQDNSAMSDLPLHHQHPRVRCISEESSSRASFCDNPLSPLATHTYGSTSEILPYLWISTTGDGLLQDAVFLKESGIVFVVNCCERDSRRNNIAIGGDYLSDEGFTTLNLNLKDDSTQSLTEAFQKFFPVVQCAKEANQKCLILCHSGMSRSVSLVIAYLLTCERMSLIEAFAHVKERRKIASPNPGFMAQLIQLERETRSSVTLDLERYKNDRFGDPFSFAVELRNSSGGNATDACTGVGGGPTYHIATSTQESPLAEDEGSVEKKKIRKRYGFASSSSSSTSPTISITPIFLQHKRYPPPRQPPGSGSSSQATLGGGGGDRKGDDVFVTFTFSFDEAKPRCSTKGHSDISVQFWEEVKQHNNLNSTPSRPYHCHSSDNSTSDPSSLHHSRSESTEFSAVQLTTDLPSTTNTASTSVAQKGNSFDNNTTSTLVPSPMHNSRSDSTEFSAVNITPDLCSTDSIQQNDGILLPSPATEAAPDSIVTSPSSVSLHQLMPMLQGVSSYVTSFLKCNNSIPVIEDQEDSMGGQTNRNIVSKRVALLDTDLES